jgi:hypothetical protein
MKKLKKPIAVALAAALLVSMTSCKLFDKAKDALNAAKTDEELYYALATAARSPGNAKSDSLPSAFTFSAHVTYGAQTVTVGDSEKERTFFYVVIAREPRNEIAIEVTDYTGYLPEEGDYVSVKAKYAGFLYKIANADGKKWEALRLEAVEVTPLAAPADVVNKTATVAVQTPYTGGELTFLNAYVSKEAFGKIIVLYFNFKNTGVSDASPILESLEFYAEDEAHTKLKRSYFTADSVDGSFLAATSAFPDKTAAGKTMPYYLTIALPMDDNIKQKDVSSFSIEIYDDDFNLAYQYIIDVAESPAATATMDVEDAVPYKNTKS